VGPWLRSLAVAAGCLALIACDEARDAASPTFEPERAGVLTVAAALPAPGFWEGTSPDAITGGFEWALATELADRFGLRLEVLDLPFSAIAAGHLDGADLAIAQISITDERAEVVDFSIGYYDTSIGVLGRDGDTVTDLKTARERRWAVVQGTTEADFLAETLRPDTEPLLVTDESEAAGAVRSGAVDAALMDLSSALVLANQDPELATLGRFLDDQRYGIALTPGSPNLELVDTTLRALISNGTIDELSETWLIPAFAEPPDDVAVIPAR
jgi:polar amino acid transport system substrate-binding protein